jgi:outer membrane protein TolC
MTLCGRRVRLEPDRGIPAKSNVGSGFSRIAKSNVGSGFSRIAKSNVGSGFSRIAKSDVGSGFSRIVCRTAAMTLLLTVAALRPAFAQPPTPTLRVTFAEAIRRAQDQNPTVAAAATQILHAESLIREARAATLLQVNGNVTTTTNTQTVEFDGTVVTPRNQVAAGVAVDMPILAAAAWARRAQAGDTKTVAELSLANVKRQIAFAAADAYLEILAQRRVVESSVSARDVAGAHFELATTLERGGTGSRLNALRAEQTFAVNVSLVEVSLLALYRAQEALGVLIAADAPADAADEPDLSVGSGDSSPSSLGLLRTDLKLFTAEQQSAERVLRDSSKDWWPVVGLSVQPAWSYPSQLFLPQYSARVLVLANIPIFDSGQRSALRLDRQATVEQSRATLAGATREASAEVRAAREAVASNDRSLTSLRTAADRAHQVLDITNISFRAGAATNIEVIDAERSTRDADLGVAVAEDRLRRARLELLNALGRFP